APPRALSRLHDVGGGDLVIPALLLGVEGGPDQSDPERDRGDDEADITNQRLDKGELGTVGLDDFELQDAHADGLTAAVARPEADEVDQTDELSEAISGDRRVERQDAVQDGAHDDNDDHVDYVGAGADPEARPGSRDRSCDHSGSQIFGTPFLPAAEYALAQRAEVRPS